MRIKPTVSRPYMPGYGVVGAKKGRLLPWSWAVKHLEKSHNYWITTVRREGRPHSVPVWGIWLKDRFYFSTGEQSRKVKNLSRNPNCVVCNERAEEAVIVEGAAEQIRDKKLIKRFNKIYEKKYDWDMESMDSPIFAVRPVVAFGFIEKSLDKTATRWKFE